MLPLTMLVSKIYLDIKNIVHSITNAELFNLLWFSWNGQCQAITSGDRYFASFETRGVYEIFCERICFRVLVEYF
jgi:plastocyanin